MKDYFGCVAESASVDHVWAAHRRQRGHRFRRRFERAHHLLATEDGSFEKSSFDSGTRRAP